MKALSSILFMLGLLSFGFGAISAHAFPRADQLLNQVYSGHDQSGQPCSFVYLDRTTYSTGPDTTETRMDDHFEITIQGSNRASGVIYAWQIGAEFNAELAKQSNPIVIREERTSMANGEAEYTIGVDAARNRLIFIRGFQKSWYGFETKFDCRF